MSDAIQVSNVDKLEPEMQNVFHMFARAANAIVRASDLGREVSKLTSEVSTLTEAYSNVDGLRQSHEARIDTLISERSHWENVAGQRQDTLSERSAEIDRLKADNSQLRRVLEMTTRQYDEVCEIRDAYHGERDNFRAMYDEAEAKLKKFREILGQPEPAVPQVEPPVVTFVDEVEHVSEEQWAQVNKPHEPIPPFLKPEGQESGSAGSDAVGERGSAEPYPWKSREDNEPSEGGPDSSVGKYEHEDAQVARYNQND